MSIATEITRLQNAKSALATSIGNKGVTVPAATKLDGYAALVDSIQTGGGGISMPEKLDNIVLNAYGAPEEITIKSGVTKVDDNAYNGVMALKKAICSNSVADIGNRAFMNTSSLTYVDIGTGITIIRDYAFRSVPLSTFICRATIPPTLSGSAFQLSGIANGTGFIYVPDNSVASYQSTSVWTNYSAQIKKLSQLP